MTKSDALALAERSEVGPNGCVLWMGATSRKGYGHLMRKGRDWAAHRLAWTVVNGPIPEGMEIDHLCRVRNCINPEHLEPVTHLENVRRAVRVVATHCKNGHEFTPENTYLTGLQRACRTCRRAATARYAAKRARAAA